MKEIKEKSVLLITQDLMTEKIISVILDKEGITYRKTDCAIDACRNKLENFSPSLIIYDLPDPRKKTLIPCGSLSSFTGRKITPQLVISTNRENCEKCTSHIKERCAFFTKPFRITEVAEKLKHLI